MAEPPAPQQSTRYPSSPTKRAGLWNCSECLGVPQPLQSHVEDCRTPTSNTEGMLCDLSAEESHSQAQKKTFYNSLQRIKRKMQAFQNTPLFS